MAGVRTRFTQLPGVSFVKIATQTGATRGVEIDNPSGSWLYIPSLETYIPPYTTGWAFGFPYDVASIDIIAGQSPAGQVSTTQGDPVVVYLTSEQIADVAGGPASFIKTDQSSTQSIPSLSVNCKSSGSGTVVLIPAVANQRIRITSLTFTSDGAGDTDIGISILSSPANLLFSAIIPRRNPIFSPSLGSPGMDFPIGRPANVIGIGIWADGDCTITGQFLYI